MLNFSHSQKCELVLKFPTRNFKQEICSNLVTTSNRGSTVVKVLPYISEGRWFHPRWCHWNFSLTKIFLIELRPWGRHRL
jgi:hypothetical protein